MTSCFDSIHGSSAGAAAGAYFLCGQADFGTRIFYEDLVDDRFISRKRFLAGRPVMDAEFLVDGVMDSVKKIEFESIRAEKGVLHIVATDVDRALACVWNSFDDYAHYRNVLKASLTLPFIAGGPRLIEGRRFVDGGLLQQIAVPSAIEKGATHILALQTRRRDEQVRPLPRGRERLQAAALQVLYGGRIGELVLRRSERINEIVQLINKKCTPAGVCLSSISLDDHIDYVHRLTQSPHELRRVAEIMKSKTI